MCKLRRLRKTASASPSGSRSGGGVDKEEFETRGRWDKLGTEVAG